MRNVNLRVRADEFVGVLGPSGCGKSTLLSCLATYLPPGRGRISFDQERDVFENQDEYRALLGHVPQKDLLPADLTVRENIHYAARLRFSSIESVRISDEVERVLNQVGLTEHADKRTEVLSGGQRKRASVAIELLKRPGLLLLDEPTSGLDPATEQKLMEQLRAISRRGTTVICTTHLMENIRLFDRVIVLGVIDKTGCVAFDGSPEQLLGRFGCRSFSDLYERLEQGNFDEVGRSQLPDACYISPPLDAAKDAPGESGANAPRQESGTQLQASQRRPSSIPASHRSKLRTIVECPLEEEPRRQLSLLLERGFTLLGRDAVLLMTLVAQPLVLGLLVCLSQYAAVRAVTLLFFLVIIVIWLGLNNSARDLVRERGLYIRERLAGLRPELFLLSKLLLHLCVGSIQIVLLLAILWGMSLMLPEGSLVSELQEDVSLLVAFLVLLMVYVGALGIGLLWSALVHSEAAAVAVLPLLIMPQLLVSAPGTGQVEEVFYTRQETPFRPLAVKLHGDATLSPGAKVLDMISLGCLSRPALLLLIKPTAARDFGATVWFADFLHLFILVVGIWCLAFLVFMWAEQQWPRLIGVG